MHADTILLYIVVTNKSIPYYNVIKVELNMISKKISKKIKLERNKRDLSQLELANLAGVDKNTIWKIETGQVSPTLDTLEKIAKALDMDFATLTDVSKVDL